MGTLCLKAASLVLLHTGLVAGEGRLLGQANHAPVTGQAKRRLAAVIGLVGAPKVVRHRARGPGAAGAVASVQQGRLATSETRGAGNVTRISVSRDATMNPSALVVALTAGPNHRATEPASLVVVPPQVVIGHRVRGGRVSAEAVRSLRVGRVSAAVVRRLVVVGMQDEDVAMPMVAEARRQALIPTDAGVVETRNLAGAAMRVLVASRLGAPSGDRAVATQADHRFEAANVMVTNRFHGEATRRIAVPALPSAAMRFHGEATRRIAVPVLPSAASKASRTVAGRVFRTVADHVQQTVAGRAFRTVADHVQQTVIARSVGVPNPFQKCAPSGESRGRQRQVASGGLWREGAPTNCRGPMLWATRRHLRRYGGARLRKARDGVPIEGRGSRTKPGF